MSFFIRKNKKQDKKRKKQLDLHNKIKTKKSKNELDDEIESESEDDEDEFEGKSIEDEVSSGGEIDETAKEKKLRLAKKYLQEIENEERERLQVDEVGDELISSRLKIDALDKIGKLTKKVADKYIGPDLDHIKCLKNGHKLPITCLVVSLDNRFVYSASKDCSIIKWDFESGKKIKLIQGGRKGTEETHVGHTSAINAIAISSDSKFLATGCNNSIINIWDTEDMKFVHKFKGHRAAINGLVFRRASHTLYSCSSDKTVKVWNVDDMCYVETLFGHQNTVTSIDCGLREKPVTSGGTDLTVRIWKIVEESQLVFQGHSGSIDCVKYINEDHFVTVGDDGLICLWGNYKKKPLCSKQLAHGEDDFTPNWITSLATNPNTDLFATGSKDGFIRVWKCFAGFKKFEQIFMIPVVGFINSLQFAKNGDYLVAGVGREHRLGRWWNLKEAKNSVLVIPLLTLNNDPS